MRRNYTRNEWGPLTLRRQRREMRSDPLEFPGIAETDGKPQCDCGRRMVHGLATGWYCLTCDQDGEDE